MHREEYLNSFEVKSFIRWLIPLLDTEGLFTHQYINRRSGQKWNCNSIYDAFKRYQWDFKYSDSNNRYHTGKSYSENTKALDSLRKQLRAAVTNNNKNDLLNVTCMIFEWGGVSAWNVDWAKNNHDKLVSIFREGIRMLNPSQADDEGPFPKRFNSGMSKVYSLLLDDFIIYDGRVGAALGFLVIRYCCEHRLSYVPRLLRFSWGLAKESNLENAKNRNPSIGNLCINPINNSQDHACWNLRASWLLKEAVKASKKFTREIDPLRSLEAALFMIGYDLGRGEKQKTCILKSTGRTVSDYPLSTHGKGYLFRADFSFQDNSVVFSYPTKSNGWKRPSDRFTIEEIIRICTYLQANFRGAAFPLANSVDRLKTNSEKPGLGMAIRTLPENVAKAQAASYLGPYLEAVGAFELVSPRPAKWKLIIEPDKVIDLIYAYHKRV